MVLTIILDPCKHTIVELRHHCYEFGIAMVLFRTCQNQEAPPSQGTKRRRDVKTSNYKNKTVHLNNLDQLVPLRENDSSSLFANKLYRYNSYQFIYHFVKLMLSTQGKNFNRGHFKLFFLFFPENWLQHFMQIVWRQSAICMNVKSCFLGKNKKKCHQFVICWICLESGKS